jgi:thiamine kinase-like enzyme
VTPYTPECLLRDWVSLALPFRRAPRLLCALDGGRTNRSYLIEGDGARWVLRIGTPEAAALGIDRRREHALFRAAAQAGLAPPLLWADAARGLLISRHLDGERLLPAALDVRRRAALLGLLSAVRELPPAGAAFDYAACVRSYLAPGEEATPTLVDCLDTLQASAATGVCHHDPGPWNVIFVGGRPWLLDWEFAASGAPVLDLAAVVVDWTQPVATVAQLTGTPRDVLDAACGFYRELCELWGRHLARLRESRAAAGVMLPADAAVAGTGTQ